MSAAEEAGAGPIRIGIDTARIQNRLNADIFLAC